MVVGIVELADEDVSRRGLRDYGVSDLIHKAPVRFVHNHSFEKPKGVTFDHGAVDHVGIPSGMAEVEPAAWQR